MKKIFRAIFVAITGFFLLYFTLLSMSSPESIDQKMNIATLIAPPPNATVVIEAPELGSLPLQDNLSIYQYDDPTSVVYMYITVRKGNSSDNTNYTWGEINDFTKLLNGSSEADSLGKSEIVFQVGDESGPLPGEVGYAETVSNATIQLRGNPASARAQKSYKIELRQLAGPWRGQTTIDLNKHIADPTRVRNKLAFDLLKQIPNTISLRTQFVRLFVKDETTDPPKITFVDYGLYTQVEQPNKKFLKNHVLDKDAQLYKAVSFEFLRYPDEIRGGNDSQYNEAAFSKILDIKGNKDHTKLIQMLNAVNNETIPIEQTFEKYFNKDNYFTWLAFNILMGNTDTNSQNFYLYSPKNSATWYFLPWDYDGSLSRLTASGNNIDHYQYGVSNYWKVPLHSRVLQIPAYREMLDAKVEELKTFLAPERIKGMLNEYRKVTDLYALTMPDILNLGVTPKEFNSQYELIPVEIEINYDLYHLSLKTPTPFSLLNPEITETRLIFNWDKAYDFNNQDITYYFEISKDWEFQRVVHKRTLLNITTTQIDTLSPGTYFWRVTATNEVGNTQYPFDVYKDADGNSRAGIKYFIVTADGSILME